MLSYNRIAVNERKVKHFRVLISFHKSEVRIQVGVLLLLSFTVAALFAKDIGKRTGP